MASAKFWSEIDRSAVKFALQNTQNDCHQWLSDICRVHQIRFLRPGPGWRSLQRSLDPNWFKGALLLREGDRTREEGWREKGREWKGREGRGGRTPPYGNSWCTTIPRPRKKVRPHSWWLCIYNILIMYNSA